MKKSIFTVLLGASLIALITGCSQQKEEVAASDINVGIILGFTGPIESLTPTMACLQISLGSK